MSKLDVLGRDNVVEQIVGILKGLRDNHQSMTFAINGKWGSGKTFVLNLLAEQISVANEKSDGSKKQFCYIRYDCWKYDYYAEPLMAMVSAMKDAIENETQAGNKDYVGRELKDTTKELGKWLIGIGGAAIKAQCGIDISKIILKLIEDDSKKRNKIFDNNLSMTKAIASLRDIIKKICSDNVLVIVIDELDRCLPEYMIKILERLHHLFEGLDDVILIVATDRGQIEYTIKHIYGENTDAVAYLQKMIQFEINLDYGELKDEIVLKNKFSEYISMFDENKPKKINMSEFFQNVFNNMEIRKVIRYIDKISLMHRLAFGNIKPGYAILYLEILLTIINKEYNINPVSKDIRIDIHEPFGSYYCSKISDWRNLPLVVYINDKCREINTDMSREQWTNSSTYVTMYDYVSDLTMMFWYWSRSLEENTQLYTLPRCGAIEQTTKLKNEALEKLEYVKRFNNLMMIIN